MRAVLGGDSAQLCSNNENVVARAQPPLVSQALMSCSTGVPVVAGTCWCRWAGGSCLYGGAEFPGCKLLPRPTALSLCGRGAHEAH